MRRLVKRRQRQCAENTVPCYRAVAALLSDIIICGLTCQNFAGRLQQIFRRGLMTAIEGLTEQFVCVASGELPEFWFVYI